MMPCYKVLFPLLLLMNISAFAQIVPTATPTPTPRPSSRQAAVSPIISDNDSYDRLRSVEMMTEQDGLNSHPLLDSKKGIYRKPSKKDVEALAVDASITAQYAAFLKEQGTGIVKLSSNFACVTETLVVVAREECSSLSMPGAGTAFSFRFENYRLPRLADLILKEGILSSGGVFQQVVMADIGDIAVSSITLNSSGVKYLIDLTPVRDTDEFAKFEELNTRGSEAGGFNYRKSLPVKLNSTYIVRSIAYREKYMRSIDGVVYDELSFDKRRDIIAVFRIVDKDINGNITFVWKKLKDVEAPKIKIIK